MLRIVIMGLNRKGCGHCAAEERCHNCRLLRMTIRSDDPLVHIHGFLFRPKSISAKSGPPRGSWPYRPRPSHRRGLPPRR